MPKIELPVSTARLSLLVTMSARVAAVVFSAATAALVGTFGGQTLLGYYSLVRVLLAIFVLLTSFGTFNAYPYLIRRCSYEPNQVLGTGMSITMIMGLAQVVLWLILTPATVFVFLKEFAEYQVILVGLAAPFYVLHLHLVHFLRSVKKVGLANLAFVSTELTLLVLIAVFAARSSLTNETVVMAVVIAWIAVAAAYLFVVSQSGFSIRPQMNRELVVRTLRYGIKTQASGVFQFLNYRIDQLIIGAFLGATDLGLYSVASKSAELFRFFSRSVSFAVEPILAGHRYEDALVFVRRNRLKIFAANLMFMTFGLFLVPAVLPLVFGDWAVAATPYFYILSIGLIVGGSNGLMGAYNKAIGEPERNTRVMLAGLLAASALNLALVPAIGISGAAWASVFAQVSVTAYFWAQFRWAGIKVSEIPGGPS